MYGTGQRERQDRTGEVESKEEWRQVTTDCLMPNTANTCTSQVRRVTLVL